MIPDVRIQGPAVPIEHLVGVNPVSELSADVMCQPQDTLVVVKGAGVATVDSLIRREKELIRGRDVWPEIQEKWARFGHLLIDDLTSEPVLLDLSSAVVKTEFLP